MKNIFTFIGLGALSMVALFAINPSQKVSDSVEWAKTTHDFGTVKMGPKANAEFNFKNSGVAPITIKSANPSCGCTASDYSHEPIMPGQKGYVKASYGTKGRPGFFKKTITVTLDNGTTQVLTITGTVTSDAGASGDKL